jgi:hypothetical protein
MAMNNISHDDAPLSSGTKKPYEKPSFRYEEVFVTTALSCTKNQNESTCMQGTPKAS